MDLGVAGSIPVSHPIFGGLFFTERWPEKNAPVAQLDRATDSGSVGQRFEPSQAYHFLRIIGFGQSIITSARVISSVGRAADS